MRTERTLRIPKEEYMKYATIYEDTAVSPKAVLLYFHGGGLLYGNREDLPELHRNTLTKEGFRIIAFDYPLSPAAGLDLIMEDVIASIHHYIDHSDFYGMEALPYFLWGRSAGAYLCLLAATKTLKKRPSGILSYYGYGFLSDGWFMTPSNYYNTLPKVSENILNTLSKDMHCDGDLDTHYSVYVYARQTGKWIDLIYTGRPKFFYLDYTLRTCEKIPCPLFCVHSIGDTDVPYGEFLELCNRFPAKRFIASANTHDFDRDETSPVTKQLLEATVSFLQQKLS